MKKRGVNNARRLRRNSTEAEKLLWRHLRSRQLGGCKFRRQEPRGTYVADFLCLERKLVVEVDGGQHGQQSLADARRTAVLARHGFRVLRFWNNDVLGNVEGVMERIREALDEEPPHPDPLPGGERVHTLHAIREPSPHWGEGRVRGKR